MDPVTTSRGPPPACTIDRIRSDDLPALIGLYHQMQPSVFSLAEMTETLKETGGNPQQLFLAARFGDTLVGTAMGVVCRMLYGGRRSFMVVEDVVVDERWRHQGIGRRLMCALEQEASKQSCSYIMLVTDSFRADSLRFYRSLGYSCEGYAAFKKHLP